MSDPFNAPRKRRKGARPSELKTAALELFLEKGFSATRMEDVAVRAGVSKGTPYLYFDSKQALFTAAIEEDLMPVLSEADEILACHNGSAFELLHRLTDLWWDSIGTTPLSGIALLMLTEARHFPELAKFYHDKVIVRYRTIIRKIFELGMANGEFRQMDISICIDLVIAPLLMLTIWKNSNGYVLAENCNPRGYLDTHLAFLKQGLQIVTQRN